MAQILNGDEEAPGDVYIFVNQLNPTTFHNYNLVGQFISGAFASTSISAKLLERYQSGTLRYLPYEPCEMDAMALSPYFLTAINDYRIEYDAETHREKYHPLFPSRLSAIYAFGDYESCRQVNAKYGWPLSEVKRFRVLQHPLNRVVKVNMEHISLARHAYRVSMLTEIDRLWEGYWSGFGEIALVLPAPGYTRKEYRSGEIWEYLIEGAVTKHDR